ncbi:MAG TPA: hypothetical protein DDW51_05675 [Cyanobacteria bacterium UBA11367]|nr:hypothetical protein [Cyanobacteria bacterium UBA11367]HBE56772.1 hypothetical protein [Cyanobacteria bacterium UBA11366]HBK83565.1 hypothetical protein [Flavobacterium sp.]HCA95977.1 hypothetical protein [Cyanobacteria bacterium UBA9226]
MQAFLTGHRNIDRTRKRDIKRLIEAALYQYDIDRVYCGMARGFDLVAADVLQNLGIKVFAVLPCRPQFQCYKWTKDDKDYYNKVLNLCTNKVVLTDKYYDGCLNQRNLWMIARSQVCISCYDGRKSGGTYHAINHSRHLDRINFDPVLKQISLIERAYVQLNLF